MICACRLREEPEQRRRRRRSGERRAPPAGGPSRAISAGTPSGTYDVAEGRQVLARVTAREATTSVDEADARAVRRARLGRRRALAREDGRVFHCGAAAARGARPRAARLGRGAHAARAGCGVLRRRGRRLRRRRARRSTDGFYGDCARALRAVPRGEVVTYGELAALAGRPGAARAAGTFCAPQPPRRRSSRCTASSPSDGIGSYGTLGVEYKRRLLALEGMSLALTTCATSSRRSRRVRRCCRLAELSALFHAAGAWHLRGTAARGAPRPREPGGRAARVRAPARPRRPLGDPHLPPPGVRPGDALPAARRRRRRGRARRCARRACSRRAARRSSVPPKRVVGRSCCRGAYLRGALLGAGSLSGPRDPHLELRASERRRRALPRRDRRARGGALVGRRAPHPRGRLREGPRDDRATCSRSPARARRRSASTSTPSSPRRARERQPARERRRGEPRSARRAPRTTSSRRSAQLDVDAPAGDARRDRGAAAAPPVAVAARARGQGAGRRSRRPRPTAGCARSCALGRHGANLICNCC